jgi:hypothetical protein
MSVLVQTSPPTCHKSITHPAKGAILVSSASSPGQEFHTIIKTCLYLTDPVRSSLFVFPGASHQRPTPSRSAPHRTWTKGPESRPRRHKRLTTSEPNEGQRSTAPELQNQAQSKGAQVEAQPQKNVFDSLTSSEPRYIEYTASSWAGPS